MVKYKQQCIIGDSGITESTARRYGINEQSTQQRENNRLVSKILINLQQLIVKITV